MTQLSSLQNDSLHTICVEKFYWLKYFRFYKFSQVLAELVDICKVLQFHLKASAASYSQLESNHLQNTSLKTQS